MAEVTTGDRKIQPRPTPPPPAKAKRKAAKRPVCYMVIGRRTEDGREEVLAVTAKPSQARIAADAAKKYTVATHEFAGVFRCIKIDS